MLVAEAVLVGRETLEATVRQGEQLQNAENMAEETEYKLDRATRLLRGMTWAGWLANKVTRDVEPPEYKQEDNENAATSSSSRAKPPAVYDQAPELCQVAAQAVQNYNCNLLVLETCETEEQKETCVMICHNMYNMATKEVSLLQQQMQNSNGGIKDDNNVINFVDRIVAELDRVMILEPLLDVGDSCVVVFRCDVEQFAFGHVDRDHLTGTKRAFLDNRRLVRRHHPGFRSRDQQAITGHRMSAKRFSARRIPPGPTA